MLTSALVAPVFQLFLAFAVLPGRSPGVGRLAGVRRCSRGLCFWVSFHEPSGPQDCPRLRRVALGLVNVLVYAFLLARFGLLGAYPRLRSPRPSCWQPHR